LTYIEHHAPRSTVRPAVARRPLASGLLVLGLGLTTGACARANDAPDPRSDAATTTLAEDDLAIDDADLEIVDILPMDAIPAIDRPEFWAVDEADRRYQPEELVLGVAFEGEARAYSIPFLSRHEIVNDSVGGRAITVTW
jgi:hypothetical protein